MNNARLMIEAGLPVLIISLGVLELIIIPLLNNRKRWLRRISVRVVIAITTLLLLVIYPEILNSPVEWSIPAIFGNGIIFRIDLLSLLFMIFSGLMFFVVSLHTSVDIKGCGRERSFYLFLMITYLATLGTLMSGDLLSFFMFFEIVTFASFVLMVHQRGQKVIEAGSTYIYFGVFGGLFILAGILIISSFTQNYTWLTLGEKFGELGLVKYVAAAFLIAGFGIKAGMVPLHHWVPVIYPKAHLSVNALSSGVLMKLGGYGILRLFVSVINSTDKKSSIHTDAVIITLENVGMIVIWLGIITMIVGVIAALEQEKIVRMLAYHSVSQMGYVIMGIGVAAYLGFEGAMGFAGALYHMINHGLFKALLFMVAAAVFFKTKEKNMYRLGGLYKQMPFTAAVGLIAVLGITGMPFFNGFASKSILHHAIIESYEYGHPVFRYAEYMFTLVSAGTAASFIKLYSKVFLGYSNDKYRHVKETYGFGTLAMAILAFFIIIIGIFPNVLMDLFIIPAAHQLSYDNYFINNYLVDMTFFNVVDLSGMITVYGLGLLIYWVGMKYNLFHLHLPKQFDPESDFYTPIYEKSGQSIKRALDMIEQFISNSDVFIYGTMLLVIITLLLNYV